jgi:uncharacterized protein YqcC (DUF446 family)
MLDTESEWWKYIAVDKLKELLSQVSPEVKFIAISPVDELALLDDNQWLLGIISVSDESIQMFNDEEETE